MFNKNDWNLILVNPVCPIPSNFLVNLKPFYKNYLVDERIIPYLSKMIISARYSNYYIDIFSAYRSIEKQINLISNSINEYISNGLSIYESREKTFLVLSLPGFSEHHTGLAIDIYSKNTKNFDNINFENTKEYMWLLNNSHKFGFILRYPRNKCNITNISFEPWHFRFVGIEAATHIYNNKICFEEFISQID